MQHKIKRRQFLKQLLASGLAAGSSGGLSALLGACQQEEAQYGEKAPSVPINVILIVVDTLRADYVGCHGNNTIKTPYIDQLASEGVLFENFFVQSSTTNPSHASFFTGLYLKNHGVYDNKTRLPEEPPTLAQVLKERGYRTAAAVSAFHLNSEYSGFGRGFDDYSNVPPPPDHDTNEFIFLTRRAAETNKEVLTWLQEQRKEPFFLWVHYFDPHTPYNPPEPFDKMYYEGGDPTDPRHTSMEQASFPKGTPNPPAWLAGIRDIDYVRSQYMGEVSYADQEIVALLSFVRELGLDDNTLVIVTSDHGEGFGEHDLYFRHWGLFDEVVHVPLIMTCPRLLPEGKRVRSLAMSVDVVPTVIDLLNISVDPLIFDGQSLCYVIGSHQGAEQDRHVYSENARQVSLSVRNKKWLAIKDLRTFQYTANYVHFKDRVQLYDRQKDPEALRDIAREHSPLVARLDAELTAWLQKRKGIHVPGDRHVRDDVAEKLRALGYTD